MAEGKSILNKANFEVLYLSYDGLTDPLGQSQILPYLQGLSIEGYSITIVSFEKADRFEKIKEQISIRCNTYKIEWVPLQYHKSPPIISTLYDLFVLQRVTKKLQKRKKFSIIHCRSYITALIGLWFKRKYKVKFIFDMRGFWVDERVEGGLWNLNNPLYSKMYKYFKKKEKEFIGIAEAVVVLTEAASQEVLSWNLNKNIIIIPCCVDLEVFNRDRFNQLQKEEIRAQLNLKNEAYVLLYIGSLGTWYLYQEMVLFFRQLKKIHPEAKFLFLTQDVEKVNSDPDFIIRTVTRDEIPKYIYACDASICFIKSSFSKKGSSATKMAEVLAMGIPMISNSGWGDVEFLKQHVEGLYVISNFSEIPNGQFLNKSFIKRQSDFFYKFFSLETGIKRYCDIYHLLISQ